MVRRRVKKSGRRRGLGGCVVFVWLLLPNGLSQDFLEVALKDDLAGRAHDSRTVEWKYL